MEVLMLMSCGCAAGAGAWLMLGGGLPSRGVAQVRVRKLAHALARAVQLACALPPVQVAARSEVMLREADELRARSARVRELGSEADVASLLVVSGACGCVLAGVLARSLVAVPVAAVSLVCWLQARSLSRRRRLRRELADEMPGVLRTLATALESGHTLVQAIEYVGLHERGHAARPFVRTSLRLRCGMSVDEALAGLGEELDAPGVDLMVTALGISQRTGSPLRDLLQRSAVLVEQQGEFERLLSVKTAQVRLSVRIVCGLPLAMVLLLAIISPDYQQGICSEAGMACLALAAMVDSLALLIVRMLMAGVM